MTTDLPFPQRIGYLTGSPVENDFPKTAQIALVHLLDALNDHGYLIARPRVVSEMLRTARLTGKEFGQDGYYEIEYIPIENYDAVAYVRR